MTLVKGSQNRRNRWTPAGAGISVTHLELDGSAADSGNKGETFKGENRVMVNKNCVLDFHFFYQATLA